MTAIAGVLRLNGEPVDRGDLARLAQALAPYGRERQGSRAYDEAGLAFALDAFTSEDVGQAQPVIGGGGRYAMVWDGRIDNREEIAAALGIESPALVRLSDAALAMRGWERWGEHVFPRLVAEFALAIWDMTDHRLLLARDPFGYRPLCYYHAGDRFAFASMPPVLPALPWVPRELDERTLANAVAQLFGENERTFFKGIALCPAGHVMTIDRGGVRLRRYYDLAERIVPIRHRRDDDYVEEARALFDEAVRVRLRSNTRVGAFMSGGLDSSTGAVVAAEQLAARGERLPVFTSVPEEGWDGLTEEHCYGDETPYVRAIAERHPALELNLVRAEGLSHYHRQDELVRLAGAPVRNAGNLPWIHAILEQSRARGIRVMLTGDNGNMTLSYRGDGIYDHLLRQGQYRRLWRELRLASRRTGQSTARTALAQLVTPRIPEPWWERLNTVRNRPDLTERLRQNSAANPAFVNEMRVVERARAVGWNYFGRIAHADRSAWRDLLAIRGSIAPIEKAFEALHGVELRDPFGDRRIVEWCFGVPEDQFHREGTGPWLLKRLMRDALPPEVLHKPSAVGRQTSDWHVRMTRERGRMLADVAAMAEDADLARMLDLTRLRAALEDWPDRTITARDDNRTVYLPVCLPMGMQVGRFVQVFKGTNA